MSEHEDHKLCCGLEEMLDDFSYHMDQVLDETYQYLADIHKMTKGQVVIVNADIDMFKQITSNKYSDIQREIEEEKKRS